MVESGPWESEFVRVSVENHRTVCWVKNTKQTRLTQELSVCERAWMCVCGGGAGWAAGVLELLKWEQGLVLACPVLRWTWSPVAAGAGASAMGCPGQRGTPPREPVLPQSSWPASLLGPSPPQALWADTAVASSHPDEAPGAEGPPVPLPCEQASAGRREGL